MTTRAGTENEEYRNRWRRYYREQKRERELGHVTSNDVRALQQRIREYRFCPTGPLKEFFIRALPQFMIKPEFTNDELRNLPDTMTKNYLANIYTNINIQGKSTSKASDRVIYNMIVYRGYGIDDRESDMSNSAIASDSDFDSDSGRSSHATDEE